MIIQESIRKEKRIFTMIVLEPQEDNYMTRDIDGDWYSSEEVEKACYEFNQYCNKISLFHFMEMDTVRVCASWINPVDSVLGGELVKKGTWLMTLHVEDRPLNDFIWQGVLDGTINGLSIDCFVQKEEIKD